MIFQEIKYKSQIETIAAALGALIVSYILYKAGFKGAMAALALPFIIVLVIYAFKKPELLLQLALVMGFLISLLSRYIPGIPFGLSIDGLLALGVLVVILRKDLRFERNFFFNPVTIMLFIWLGFSFIELFNPLARSKIAWFYANRGLSFYPVLMLLLSYVLFDSKKQIKWMLAIWAGLSLLGTFWGIKQLFLGVSATEQQWLNAGAASTHVLFGKLRVFSYYSDAAQFGANQAYTGLVFGIMSLYSGKIKYRYLFLLIGLLSLYGMLISGTRGALGIIALGGFTYFLLTKNFKVILAGILAAAGMFVFLKYTTILQSNYQVNRLRTALNADDPSLQVRKEREAVLAGYLSNKPLGGGIGSAGFWGKRFTPGTFLAELGTDGHYTRLWMETGVIGLNLYILMLLIIIFYLGSLLWKMPESKTRQLLVALFSGFVGLCLASYTNGLLTQIPTGNIVFMSFGIIYLGAKGKLKK